MAARTCGISSESQVMTNRSKHRGVLAAAAITLGGGGARVAAAEDDDRLLTGAVHDRAARSALQHVGEGTVTETEADDVDAAEAGDDEDAYEVQVRREDGSQVEVELNKNFDVVESELGDDEADADEPTTPETTTSSAGAPGPSRQLRDAPGAATRSSKDQVQRRHHEQVEQRRGHEAAHDDYGHWVLDLVTRDLAGDHQG